VKRLAPLLLLFGCNQKHPVTYEADVKPLVVQHCEGCHVEGGIAPFTLTSYDDVVKMEGAMLSDMQRRVMPPFLAGPNCTDYQHDLRLSDEQISTFEAWIDGGSVRGEYVDAGSPPAPPGLTRVDTSLSMSAPYTPTLSPDDYHCFLLDWPSTTDTYVVGMQVRPGNPKIVHHVIAYLVDPTQVAQAQMLDDAEPGPGYTCFGGPKLSSNGWLGSWAPGGQGAMYPDRTGIKVQAGSKVIMQVHYNLLNAAGETPVDQSSLDLALSDSVGREALIMPWTNPDWVRNHTMDIPAFQQDVTFNFSYDPTPYMALLTKQVIQGGEPFHIYAAAFHQHLLGTGGRIEITHPDGGSDCMVDLPRWDFHWQRSYAFTQSKQFNPGDQLSLTCHFDNSAAHQPVVGGMQQMSRDVNWGEGTTDEMCLGILYLTQ
jgi:hypothetical protein